MRDDRDVGFWALVIAVAITAAMVAYWALELTIG